jgi:hypothetical protein
VRAPGRAACAARARLGEPAHADEHLRRGEDVPLVEERRERPLEAAELPPPRRVVRAGDREEREEDRGEERRRGLLRLVGDPAANLRLLAGAEPEDLGRLLVRPARVARGARRARLHGRHHVHRDAPPLEAVHERLGGLPRIERLDRRLARGVGVDVHGDEGDVLQVPLPEERDQVLRVLPARLVERGDDPVHLGALETLEEDEPAHAAVLEREGERALSLAPVVDDVPLVLDHVGPDVQLDHLGPRERRLRLRVELVDERLDRGRARRVETGGALDPLERDDELLDERQLLPRDVARLAGGAPRLAEPPSDVRPHRALARRCGARRMSHPDDTMNRHAARGG